ncbi:efflux RND transporter permease subunit [Thioalkalicoccus limnaeus]|uniref:Efflux RND transporter permease subunit n=1 Tax=Thioalkalicoccus limnaeus TaxID=120681 RepID=A0ABV4BGZ3_9GAMM
MNTNARDTGHRRDLIGLFAHHKVAANLLMVLMILSGVFALDRLNVQFFPSFDLDVVTVRVIWSGASAEDIEEGITTPLEQRLRAADNLRRMTSTSTQGISAITLEFRENIDPLLALDQVRRLVDDFRNLPQDAEKPEIALVTRYESVARLVLTGVDRPDEMRHLARRFEAELLERGIDTIDLRGLPPEEISIQVDHARLTELGVGLPEIGERVAASSRDLPAGAIGRGEAARELRSLDRRRDEVEFGQLPVKASETLTVQLGDIATIERVPRDGTLRLSVDGRPAVEMVLQRAESGNSLTAARILEDWLAETRPQLPPGVELLVYDASWELIRDRIMLLVTNGLGGLVLVVAILFLFLSGRVAFWVAWGIPVSFLATLFILYLFGGSINMLSLFALIMALGIIVDDAIVVGEDAMAHHQMGEAPLLAAEGGVRRMLAPVVASSLTTIAAFLPLMLVGGTIGNILGVIPLVIVAVILASLIESLLVLPGHLRTAFVHSHKIQPRSLRARLDRGFERFRDQVFRPLVTVAVHHRFATIAAAIAALLIALGLFAGGRLAFVFFPTPEGQIITANATFVAGTPRAQVDALLRHLDETLWETERALDQGQLVNLAVAYHGGRIAGGTGDQLGALQVELVPSDAREIRNEAFIRAWRERIELPPGIESFTVTARRGGPPGRDLTVRLYGADSETLKDAALDLAEVLRGLPGVSAIEDDMAFGREQIIYSLTPAGQALGLTILDLGTQLRTAFEGQLVQIFQDGADEVEVRVKLPRAERDRLGSLERMNIRLPDGSSVPLTTVADWSTRRGFEVLRHAEGQLAVEVSADVDAALNNAVAITEDLEESVLPALQTRYGLHYSFEGRSADQRETLEDLRKGVVLGLILIYVILAWVFASYSWPLVVMTAIPFGLTGALLGHWMIGIDVTILSLFGMFGLSGIVINDSIILVKFYQQQLEQGLDPREALIEAACQRLRAVLLTSLTTIAGLTPLLFEKSVQAQFLIPMATSIAFGLGFATLLILLVVPAMLSIHESLHRRLGRLVGAVASTR